MTTEIEASESECAATDNLAFRVTVGLPVYNSIKFLARALDSVLKQTYTNMVIFISDNYSTDGTYEYCCKIAKSDSRIVVIRNGRNIGALENFRLLLNKCNTEYFFWAASDDFFDKRFVERAVEVMDEAPDTGSVFCHFRILNYTTGEIGELITPLPSASNVAWRRLLYRFMNPVSSLIYGLHRTSLIKEIMNKLPNFDYIDYYVTQEIAARAPILVIPLDMYRLGVPHATRVSHAANRKKIRIRQYLFLSLASVRRHSFGLRRILLMIILLIVTLRFWIVRPRAVHQEQ